jgi:PPOX class probable F420-dependent enzyme
MKTTFIGRQMLAPARRRTKDERLSPVHLDQDEAMRRAIAADHGVLATLDRTHGASLVPACYAIDGDRLAIPIDSVKPKGSTALGRVRNLERDPRASLLIEHWDAADWSRLWWVHILLVRTVDEPAERLAHLVRGLSERYAQYRDAPFVDVLTFRIEKIGGWEAAHP